MVSSSLFTYSDLRHACYNGMLQALSHRVHLTLLTWWGAPLHLSVAEVFAQWDRHVAELHCPALFPAAALYLERLRDKLQGQWPGNGDFVPAQLLSVALGIAHKFLADEVYANAHYARLAGLPPKIYAHLEKVFTQQIEWDLELPPAGFDTLVVELTKSPAQAPQPHRPCRFKASAPLRLFFYQQAGRAHRHHEGL